MGRLTFLQLEKKSTHHFEIAKDLWLPFIREVNAHDNKKQTDEQILDGLRKRIDIQGVRKDMHFEVAFLENQPIGIAMFAIDLGTVYGLLEKGHGTVMGFYICPEFRRKGFGREFWNHIEKKLCLENAVGFYVCPDAITGIAFWKSVGFTDSGKIDPDHTKPIYIKPLCNLHFIRIYSKANDQQENFRYLMHQYTAELDEHQSRTTPSKFIEKWIDSILRMQGDPDRHLELCYDGDTLVGFFYGKIDHPKHKGFIKPHYGYIMELFVLPEHRRKGYGKAMFERLQALLSVGGAKRMYLTSDPVTGKPFWESLGFLTTGECSPENGQEIYEKAIVC